MDTLVSEQPVSPVHESFTRNESSSTERNVRNGKRKAISLCLLLLLGRKLRTRVTMVCVTPAGGERARSWQVCVDHLGW